MNQTSLEGFETSMRKIEFRSSAAGFTLAELMIAMTVTLVMAGLASILMAGSFNIRARENQKTEALADTQRGLNLMTR